VRPEGDQPSPVKEDRPTGRAHAALVSDEEGAAGGCQYGSQRTPGIKHKREYDMDAPPRPDWRITCFYVDKNIAVRASHGRRWKARSTRSPMAAPRRAISR
jgi:hypothetical protein